MIDSTELKELVAEMAHHVVETKWTAICTIYKTLPNGDQAYVNSVQEDFNQYHDVFENMLCEALGANQ